MSTFNVHQAKTHLSRMLERAVAGEEIVIAKAGKPLVRLVPVGPREPRRPGLITGRVTDAFFEPLPREELDAWEGGRVGRAGRGRPDGGGRGGARGK